MSPRALVAAWTTRLALVGAVCALLVGIGAGGVAHLVSRWLGATETAAVLTALVVGLIGATWEGWRLTGGRLTPVRVSLWLEERAPGLEFALVSAVERGDAPAALLDRIAAVDVNSTGWRAVHRALWWPLALALAGVFAMALGARLEALPGAVARMARESAAPGDPLATIRGRIEPPAYARLPVEEYADADVLHPLVGSAVVLSGRLPEGMEPATIAARVDSAVLRPARSGDRWAVRLVADTATHVVRLAHATTSRLVVIEPRRDSLPVVTIEQPARDTILREPRGTFALRARATDDIGLASAAIEYIISSGDGERFTFRSGTLGAVRPSSRAVTVTATFDAVAMKLAAGDVVHLRAVARDGKTIDGPGVGSSDTRTIRVARAGEYDSVAVDPAPPAEADKSLLSQRMLINLTEALVRRMRTLGRDDVVAESRRISRDQTRLRKQVSDLVFARLGDDASGEHFHGDGHDHDASEPLKRNLTPEELLAAAEKATGTGQNLVEEGHDETPIVAINKPLLEAYNAMWDAGRELDTGRPRTALPPMYVALAAIQKARAAERLYLRGLPPRVVVDLGKARLAGKERGKSVIRAASRPAEPLRRTAIGRIERALALGTPGAAADSLLIVRLSIVGQLPDAARAMDALIAAVRSGRDASADVEAVRRSLDAGSSRRDAISFWTGPRP
ncbi:MAG: hypothetical protein IT361_14060 [Gemmatimonadaceae bacterium]|nr:hypothetical protein [Gemmatimonadaceae bacterium]